MISTIDSLREREELCCPDCKKPLVIRQMPDGSSRFEGCGRNCRPLYHIPDDNILFGALGAPLFIYVPKTQPNCIPRYQTGGW
jgi:hypothetical protein